MSKQENDKKEKKHYEESSSFDSKSHNKQDDKCCCGCQSKLENIQFQLQLQQQFQLQLQAQLQAQSQSQTDTDTISNVGNPVVNVNVSTSENGDDTHNLNLVRPSAFRATNIATSIPVLANNPVKVLFSNELFDLADEYNPATSTFIPATDGVYYILSTITFEPNNQNIDYRARVDILVNGNSVSSLDNDFWNGVVFFSNIINVSTILHLQAGDRVEVFAQSSTDVSILVTEAEITTHFAAARFPSPTT